MTESPDDAPDCIVTRVDRINGSCASVCYSVNRIPQSRIRVYRKTWAFNDAYWPPSVGDVIDPKFGTLKLRPRT